jgi:hypothetical protein
VQIHANEPIDADNLEHVSNIGGGDGFALVALALVLPAVPWKTSCGDCMRTRRRSKTGEEGWTRIGATPASHVRHASADSPK